MMCSEERRCFSLLFSRLSAKFFHWAAGTRVTGRARLWACRLLVGMLQDAGVRRGYNQSMNIRRAFSTEMACNALLLVCASSPSPSSEAVVLQYWQPSRRPSVLEQSPAQMGIRAMALVVFLGVQNPRPDCNYCWDTWGVIWSESHLGSIFLLQTSTTCRICSAAKALGQDSFREGRDGIFGPKVGRWTECTQCGTPWVRAEPPNSWATRGRSVLSAQGCSSIQYHMPQQSWTC